MHVFLRGLKWVLGLGVLVLAAYVGFVGIMRMTQKPTAEQAAALAVLEAPNPSWEGMDAAPALWAMGYDIPESGWVSVLQADVPVVDAPGGDQSDGVPGRGQFPELPKLDNQSPGLCRAAEPCLPVVRDRPQEAAALLQIHAKRLEQAWSTALLDAGFSRYPFKPHFASPIAARASPMHLVRTQLAQRFLSGDATGALEGSCRQISAARRLAERSDSLIVSMVNNRAAEEYGSLIAEMLAELPTGTAIPNICSEALVPMPPEELDICPAVRTDYRTLVNSISEFPEALDILDHPDGWDSPWVYFLDADMLYARSAPMLAFVCQEAVQQAVATDRDVPNTMLVECSTLESLADPTGCNLLSVAVPPLSQYSEQRMDLRAQLQALNLVLWLRAQAVDPRPLDQKFAERPAHLALSERDLRLEETGRAISLKRLQERNGQGRMVIPLPEFASTPSP
jgi:hypothetical protein